MKGRTKYVFCEAPLCQGSPTKGSELAFSHLIKNGLTDISPDTFRSLEYTGKREFDSRLNNSSLLGYETVIGVNREHRKNLLSVFEKGGIPVTVGGDHSIAMSSIAAAAETFGAEDLAVIYIDGHADINTEKSSLTGRIHGMPLAASMGICTDLLTVGKNKVNLYGKNTFIVGARSIDAEEYNIIEKQGVTMYTAEQVQQMGCKAVISEVLDKITDKKIHISFDVDSIDGDEFPATGYKMPYGLSFDSVYSMIDTVLKTKRVCSIDCVEYNPTLDCDGKCLSMLLKLFSLLK